MSYPITTTGTTSDPISTEYDSPELIRVWVARHTDDVKAATPSANTLTTSWTSNNGAQQVQSVRKANEVDLTFVERHVQEYLIAMTGEPPIP